MTWAEFIAEGLRRAGTEANPCALYDFVEALKGQGPLGLDEAFALIDASPDFRPEWAKWIIFWMRDLISPYGFEVLFRQCNSEALGDLEEDVDYREQDFRMLEPYIVANRDRWKRVCVPQWRRIKAKYGIVDD